MPGRARPYLVYGGMLAVVAVAGGLAYGQLASSGAPSNSRSRVVTVQRGTVSQTISVSGNLEPAGQTNVNFGTNGKITEIDVKVGDTVVAGQVLAKLDPTSAQAQLDVSQLNLTAAQQKLDAAEAGTTGGQGGGGSGSSAASGASVAQLQAEVHDDQVALDDAQQTAQINANGYQLAVDQAQQQLTDDQNACNADATSPKCDDVQQDQNALANAQQAQAAGTQRDQVAVHQAQAKLDTDQAALAAAQASARDTTATTAPTVDLSAVASAKSALVSAQNAYDSAQQALAATTLTAPAAGTVTQINEAVGDTVGSTATANANTTGNFQNSSQNGSANANGNNQNGNANASSAFLTIVDPTAYQVSVAIPEADAVNVKVGQLASVTVDALAGTALDGAVASVASTSTVSNNVVTYAATISVSNPPSTLKAGMSASVAITTLSKDNVLEAPTAAITTQGGSSYVQKLVDGTPVQTQVDVGIQGDNETEITGGLSAGDQVEITITTVTAANGNGTGAGTGGTLTGGGGGFGGGGFGGGGGGFRGGGVN